MLHFTTRPQAWPGPGVVQSSPDALNRRVPPCAGAEFFGPR